MTNTRSQEMTPAPIVAREGSRTVLLIQVPRPGTAGGPCADPACAHEQCHSQREVEHVTCTVCGDPVGYVWPVHMTVDETRDERGQSAYSVTYTHRACAERA